MTPYELVGLLAGFVLLGVAAATLWYILGALDEGTHGCSRVLPSQTDEIATLKSRIAELENEVSGLDKRCYDLCEEIKYHKTNPFGD